MSDVGGVIDVGGMTEVAGVKLWFTAAEIAELDLTGLPATKRKINELAQDKRWALREGMSRPRAGRGGGAEYHYSVLPPSAVSDLVRRGLVRDVAAVELSALTQVESRSERWAWFERQTDKIKAEARRRLSALDDAQALMQAGVTKTGAVVAIAGRLGVSTATVWNWFGLVEGVEMIDRLPRLAPAHKGGGAEAEIHPAAWQFFKSDYLRPERPTYAACRDHLMQAAGAQGWGCIPHVKTLQRRLEREVDHRVIAMERHGRDALRETVPPQQRSIEDLHAMECVNIDGHRWDVFVRWPDGVIARPMMVAIQDIRSRKVLAWRIGREESAVQTRLCFSDVFRDFGIPTACLLDNGRAFASKWITGGVSNRYRFKVREEEPLGLLPALGIKVHWALPYRGSSKPIERAFKVLCDGGAKHPEFSGAYTGNSVAAKPENYGNSAVPIETFRRVVGQIMAFHNAKPGRRTEAAKGRSYDAAFEESYASAPIGRATPEHMRLALLAAELVRADPRTGAVRFCDNTFFDPELARVAGQKVVLRFDPDNLHGEVHVYDQAGGFIATAANWGKVGFFDVEAAKARAKQEANLRKVTKEKSRLQDLISAEDLAALMPAEDEAPEAASPNIIRPVRQFGRMAAAAHRPLLDTHHDVDRFAAAASRLRVVD